MKTALMALSVILMLTGLVCSFMGRRHRKPGAPSMPSFNPIYWFQPWNIGNWLTPTGLKYWFVGNACMMSGVAIGSMAIGLKGLFE